MIPFKQYIAEQLLNQTLRFKCDCLMPFDVVGKIVDYTIAENEVIFSVNVDGRIMKIGTNHPKLSVKLA